MDKCGGYVDEVLTFPQSKAKNVDNFAQYFRKRTVLKPDTSRISEKKITALAICARMRYNVSDIVILA